MNLSEGTQLWVTLASAPWERSRFAGIRNDGDLQHGSLRVSRDAVRVYSALPDISSSQQILIGGAFQ